jgi:hypothetical protein
VYVTFYYLGGSAGRQFPDFLDARRVASLRRPSGGAVGDDFARADFLQPSLKGGSTGATRRSKGVEARDAIRI